MVNKINMLDVNHNSTLQFFGGHIIKCLCKMGHEFDDMKGYLPICVGNIPAN